MRKLLMRLGFGTNRRHVVVRLLQICMYHGVKLRIPESIFGARHGFGSPFMMKLRTERNRWQFFETKSPIPFQAGASRPIRQHVPPLPDTPASPGRREIGDLRVQSDIAGTIAKALPEGANLDEDRVTLCGLSIQFHRIVKGTQYFALLYIDEGYEELTYSSWFLSAVCLRLIATTKGLKRDEPSVEIIATRPGLLPEDWLIELDVCVEARITRYKRITRIKNGWPHDQKRCLVSSVSGCEGWGSIATTVKANEVTVSASSQDQAPPMLPSPQRHTLLSIDNSPKGPLVFLSYSHDDDDAALANRLKKSLRQLDDEFKVKAVWTDEDIKTSEEWFASIQQAMKSARVVVALATPSFFDSDFIKDVELKAILDARVKNEKGLAWILGAACAYPVYGLKEIQAACSIKPALNKLEPGDLDEQLEIVRRNVSDLVRDILAGESSQA